MSSSGKRDSTELGLVDPVFIGNESNRRPSSFAAFEFAAFPASLSGLRYMLSRLGPGHSLASALCPRAPDSLPFFQPSSYLHTTLAASPRLYSTTLPY